MGLRRIGLAACTAAVMLVPLGSRASVLAPIVKGPFVQRLTATSAVVAVEVDPPQAASIALEGDAGASVPPSPQVKSFHTFTLTGLEPARRYTYVARAGGASKPGSFTTAPPEGAGADFGFTLYGDTRSDPDAHAQIARAMGSHPASFLINTGDLVAEGQSAPDWQEFFDIEAPLLRDRPLFAAVGNHELTDRDASLFLRYFPPETPPAEGAKPRLYGTFRWGTARFFLLNAMEGWRDGVEKAWLSAELDRADAEPDLVWRVAVMHHGPWSSGPHGRNRALHDAGIVALLRKHKIDLVAAGHDHLYERGESEGTRYVVTGGGGAPSYEVKGRLSTTRVADTAHHFIDVKVTKDKVTLFTYRADGSLIEACGFGKKDGWDCDAPVLPVTQAGLPDPPRSERGDTPSAPTAAASRCGCDVVGARAGGRLSPGLGLVGAALLLVRRRRAAPRSLRRGARTR